MGCRYEHELMESEIILPFKIRQADFIEANRIFLTDVSGAGYPDTPFG